MILTDEKPKAKRIRVKPDHRFRPDLPLEQYPALREMVEKLEGAGLSRRGITKMALEALREKYDQGLVNLT